MDEPFLRVRDLELNFGGIQALQGVGFEIEEGSIIGLMGSNGAGKTTIFNAITGFVRPDSGSILFAGRELIGTPPYLIARSGLSRTFQHARPLADLTVLENVMAGAFRNGRSGPLATVFGSRKARYAEAKVQAQALNLIEGIGLAGLDQAFPSELTAGQLRLLEIARALAAQPRLLLLDEPAAGLNHDETESVAKFVRKLPAQGVTCLLVEHDVDMVFDLCERITVLYYGRVIGEGTPGEIRTNRAVIDSYLGSSTSANTGADHAF